MKIFEDVNSEVCINWMDCTLHLLLLKNGYNCMRKAFVRVSLMLPEVIFLLFWETRVVVEKKLQIQKAHVGYFLFTFKVIPTSLTWF